MSNSHTLGAVCRWHLKWLAAIRNLVASLGGLLAVAGAALAAPYGHYDARQITRIEQGRPVLDVAVLDRQLADLRSHAGNYPPRFDSAADAQRARHDVNTLMGMFGAAFTNDPVPTAILLRMGMIGALGHNLGLQGSAAFAQTHFERLLKAEPQHALGNYHYGVFLGSSNRAKEALPLLTQAKAAGLADATYALGMTHLMLGDKTQALVEFKAYQSMRPSDPNVAKLIEAVEAGKVVMRK